MNKLAEIGIEVAAEEVLLYAAVCKALDTLAAGKSEVNVKGIWYTKKVDRWVSGGRNSPTHDELHDYIESVAQSILDHVDEEYDRMHERKTNLISLREVLEEVVIE